MKDWGRYRELWVIIVCAWIDVDVELKILTKLKNWNWWINKDESNRDTEIDESNRDTEIDESNRDMES